MFIDVHCHLDLLKDKNQAIKNAISKNVKIIMTSGIDKKTNRISLNLVKKYQEIKMALGVYPINALKMQPEELKKEIDFIKSKNPDAIGEVGLDYKESQDALRQIPVFKKFIKFSKELNKPIIVHSRKAEEDCINILVNLNAKKVVMHCFSGNHKLVQRIRDREWFFSIPAIVINSQHFQKIVYETPLNQLLCETDSPFLHPHKLPNNEPANVLDSYKKISEIKNLPLKEVERQIENNYHFLFET